MMYKILTFLNKIFPAKEVFAHCDIPCGIYEVDTAKTAAKTVLTMVQKILALPKENSVEKCNSMVRLVQEKEEEAQKCKTELLILWTDYFKSEHLEMFPNLHETFWKAAKLCSKAKQEVRLESATALQNAVEEIAQMFAKAEEAKTKN